MRGLRRIRVGSGPVLLLVVAVGCTPTGRTPASTGRAAAVRPVASPDDPPPLEALHVVTTLQTRDHEVTVYAGDDGLRFTVVTAGDGELLARRLPQDEFARSFPGIYRNFETAFADEARLDASARMPQTPGAWSGL